MLPLPPNDTITFALSDIIASDASQLVKRTALTLQQRGYFTVGDWLAELSDDDVHYLVTAAGDLRDDVNSRNVVLLTYLLCMAEGVTISRTDISQGVLNVSSLMVVLSAEALYRAGLIRSQRANSTLDGSFTFHTT